MTIIKTNKVKEIFENIKQEQKVLNNLERLEDWEERFIEQSEELEEIEKDLESKTKEAERNERAFKLYIENTLKKEKEMEQRIEALEKKDESKQISLLKETHQKEIKELNDKHRNEIFTYGYAIEDIIKKNEEVRELKKELEEEKLLVEHLKGEIEKVREDSETHLDFIAACEKFNKEKDQMLRGKWASAKKKAHDRKILLRQLEYFNKELPPLPQNLQTSSKSKFKLFKDKVKMKFHQLLEKRRINKQELVARIEVRTNN